MTKPTDRDVVLGLIAGSGQRRQDWIVELPFDMMDALLAGPRNSGDADVLSSAEKERLLDALRRANNGTPRKITLTRKSVEFFEGDVDHEPRTIQVEVRKKRVFVKRGDLIESPVVRELDSAEYSSAELSGPLVLSGTDAEQQIAENDVENIHVALNMMRDDLRSVRLRIEARELANPLSLFTE